MAGLPTVGFHLPANLHRANHQLGLAEEIEVRLELDIILPLLWYWGVVF